MGSNSKLFLQLKVWLSLNFEVSACSVYVHMAFLVVLSGVCPDLPLPSERDTHINSEKKKSHTGDSHYPDYSMGLL